MNFYQQLHKDLASWAKRRRMGWTDAVLHENTIDVGHNLIDWKDDELFYDFTGKEWEANKTTAKAFYNFIAEDGDPHERFEKQVEEAPEPTPDTYIPLRWRKTKTGEWVVYGPADMINAHTTVQVTRKDGRVGLFDIGNVSKPFMVDGRPMRYGYKEARANEAPPPPDYECGLCQEDEQTCMCSNPVWVIAQ